MFKRDKVFLDIVNEADFDESLYKSGMFYVDFSEGFGQVSKVITQLGFNVDNMLSGEYQNSIHPDDIESYLSLWNRFFKGSDDELYCEYRLRDLKNNWIWVQTHSTVLSRNDNDSIRKIIGFDRIINSRKKTEEIIRDQLIEAKNKIEISEIVFSAGKELISDLHLLENLNRGLEKMSEIVDFDYCDIYIYKSKFERIVIYPQGETFTIPNSEELLIQVRNSKYPIIKENLLLGSGSSMAIPLIGDGDIVGAIIIFNQNDGVFSGADLYPVLGFADVLSLAILNYITLNSIVSDLERDHLTGFLSRKSFEKTILSTWEDFSTNYQKNSVCMLDIDHFKKVNDTYGHQIGDDVIREIAFVCKNSLRDQDILGRYGGEEFVAVLPNTGFDNVSKIMERIRKTIEGLKIPGMDEGITISIGISISNSSNSIESIINKADSALYEAKQTGRNRIVINH